MNFLRTARGICTAEADPRRMHSTPSVIPQVPLRCLLLWGTTVAGPPAPTRPWLFTCPPLPRHATGRATASATSWSPSQKPLNTYIRNCPTNLIHFLIFQCLSESSLLLFFSYQYDVSVWCCGEQECHVPYWESTPPAGRQLPGVSESCQTQPCQRILHQWLITGSA